MLTKMQICQMYQYSRKSWSCFFFKKKQVGSFSGFSWFTHQIQSEHLALKIERRSWFSSVLNL